VLAALKCNVKCGLLIEVLSEVAPLEKLPSSQEGCAMVNGNSIVRETMVAETLTYYHFKLDDHSLILAEATPA
jgi:hypothetical protein